MAPETFGQAHGKSKVSGKGRGASKRRRAKSADAWWKTVTHYTPLPWLIARRAVDARMRQVSYAGC